MSKTDLISPCKRVKVLSESFDPAMSQSLPQTAKNIIFMINPHTIRWTNAKGADAKNNGAGFVYKSVGVTDNSLGIKPAPLFSGQYSTDDFCYFCYYTDRAPNGNILPESVPVWGQVGTRLSPRAAFEIRNRLIADGYTVEIQDCD